MNSIKNKDNKDFDNNSLHIIEKIFDTIGVKYTTYNIIKILNSFPIKGSLEAIQLVLKKYNIDSLPTKLVYSHLIEMKHTAVLYISTLNYSLFSILIEANTAEITHFTPHSGYQKESATQFMSKWDGITLLLNTSEFVKKEPNIFYNRIMGVLKYQTGVILFFTLLLIDGIYFTMFRDMYLLIFLDINCAGVFFCLTYLLKEQNNTPLKLDDFKIGSLLNLMTSSKIKGKILCLLSLTYFIYTIVIVFTYKLYFLSIIPLSILIMSSLVLYFRFFLKPDAKLLSINLIFFIELFYFFFALNVNHQNLNRYGALDIFSCCLIFIVLYHSLKYLYINIKTTNDPVSTQFNDTPIANFFQKSWISLKKVSPINPTCPFLKFKTSGVKDILLLIDPYDNRSGSLFIELLNYLKKEPCYNLILGFFGQENDARYCQFVNFVIFQYDNDSKENLLNKVEWWYQQDIKIFDRFIQLFPQSPVEYNEKLKNWNKWIGSENILNSCLIVDGMMLPEFSKFNYTIDFLNFIKTL